MVNKEPELVKKNFFDKVITHQKRLLVFLTLFITIIVLSSSYALLTNFDKTDNVINFTTGKLHMTINNVFINLNGKLPENDESGLQNSEPIIFTLTNTGTMLIEGYDVKLVSDPEKVSTLNEIYLKYAISLDNGKTYSTPDLLKLDNNIIYTGYNLNVNESKTIYLKVWLDESSGNHALNKEYYGSIVVDLYQKKDIPERQVGIYITEVTYKSNVNANLNESKINFDDTTLNTNVALSNDINSSIEYQVTIYNDRDFDYKLENISNENYSNEFIAYELEGFQIGDTLKSKESVTFDIKFKYREGVTLSNEINELIASVNFEVSLIPVVVGAYDYTNTIETYQVSHSGIYKLEVWGAQGGSANATYRGGYGGYSTGSIELIPGDDVFVVVGSQGEAGTISKAKNGGYNGGGSIPTSSDDPDNRYVAAGGGATHMATKIGLLYELVNNVDSVLIVAGGGGGGYKHTSTGYYGVGGDAGGFEGKSGNFGNYGNYYGTGGTQTAPGYAYGKSPNGMGSFGLGGSLKSDSTHGSAGGAGYYGGGSSFGGIRDTGNSSGGGGSSYIGNSALFDKYMICYECNPSSVESTKTISTKNVSQTPVVDNAKIGNGYARITILKEVW